MLREADADDSERVERHERVHLIPTGGKRSGGGGGGSTGGEEEADEEKGVGGGPRDGGKVGWKRTAALHLLMNCSSVPSKETQVYFDFDFDFEKHAACVFRVHYMC